MSNRFLSTSGSGNTNLTNGSADLFINSLGISNLDQSLPIKTNASRELITSKLDQTDVNNLQTDLNLKSELSYTKSDTHTNPPAGQIKTYFKTDGNFYKKDETGTETKVAGGGTGDVQGPATSVDNTVPRFDATTGKIIQGSGVIIDDSNNITTPGYISATSGGITGTLSTNTVQPITTNNFDIGAVALRYNNIYGNNFINALGSNIDVTSEVSSNVVNQIVTFSSTDTSGKKIKNSAVVIDASNNMTNINNLNVNALTETNDLNIYGLTNSKNINNVGTITTQGIKFQADNAADIGETAKQAKDLYMKGDIKFNKPTQNILLGINAGGSSITTGNNNTGIGQSTLANLSSGIDNVCIGQDSGKVLTTSNYNTAIGRRSLYTATTGGINTCVGLQAGAEITTGSNNTCIGSLSNASASAINQISLGYDAVNDIDNSCVIGNVLLGNIRPSTNRVCDLGTTTRNFKDFYGDKVIINTQAQSNKYYNNNGNAGIEIANTANAAITLNGGLYQGKNTQIVTLNGSGQIQQPSANSTIDANGNGTFKNLDLLNIAGGGTFRGNKLQSNDVAKTLELFNRATVNGVGILVDNTAGGNITLTGSSYSGVVNRIMKVSGTGQIELSNATIDASGNLIASNTTLDSLTLKNNLNFDLDNAHDVGTAATSARNIYYKSNLSGANATFTGQINSSAIIPITTSVSDIGSNTLKYKDLYLNGTMYATNSIATSIISTNLNTQNLTLTPAGGVLNCNSANITNTGDIIPISDNTEDIGSGASSYRNIYAKGDFIKSGVARGDVFGPTTATDNKICIFNGATGKIIKESAASIVGNTLSVPRVDGSLSSPVQQFFSSNTTYGFYMRNSDTLPSNIQIYGCNTSAGCCLNYVADNTGQEASGFGMSHPDDAFTIFCPGDAGSICNFQDEDSSNSRVSYIDTGGNLQVVSSRKRKNRIRNKTNNDVLERFKKVEIKSYGYNCEDEKPDWSDKKKARIKKKRDKMYMGVVLEEIFEVFPNVCASYYNKLGRSKRKTNLVFEDEIKNPENSGVDYLKLQLYHIMAFQEYIKKTDTLIESQGARIAELEEKLKSV